MCDVLIIDDEENLCSLYQKELNEYGLESHSVTTVEDALDFLESRPEIELIVLDIILKGENVLEKLETLREKFPNTSIVINTAYSLYKHDFKTWLADAYLVKSPDLTEFNRTINQLLTMNKDTNGHKILN